MILYDTHCHIAGEAFEEDLTEVLLRMRENGLTGAMIASDPDEDASRAAELCGQYPQLVFAAGLHPHNASKWTEATEKKLRTLAKDPNMRVLGEIGLDYHYDLSPREDQRRVFALQLDLAEELGLPVQLHIREAHGDCMDLLRARAREGHRIDGGILHCFTGSPECAEVYLGLGMYISLSGAVTFKNAPKLSEVARIVPADRLLIETDCPYMAPVPLRGQRNEPANVRYTLLKIAELRGEDPEQTARITTENAMRALRLPQPGEY